MTIHSIFIQINPKQNDLYLYLYYSVLYLCRHVLARGYSNPAPGTFKLEQHYFNLAQDDFKT